MINKLHDVPIEKIGIYILNDEKDDKKNLDKYPIKNHAAMIEYLRGNLEYSGIFLFYTYNHDKQGKIHLVPITTGNRDDLAEFF